MTDRTPDIHGGQPPATPVSGKAANWLGATFYVAVAAVAFAGQVLAAVHWLHWPLLLSAPAIAVLELGGIALAARADFRRRLNEAAIASRTLSAAVAVFAVVFNWVGHAGNGDRLAGAFFAGMSALGYGVWLINAGDRRRDQLRAEHKLPPPPPSYETWQWIAHPLVTWRARSMAKAKPELGTYGSLAAAVQARREEKRTAAITKVVRRLMRNAEDPFSAGLAEYTYDLDAIAARVVARADYEGLAEVIAAGLTPERLTAPRRNKRRGWLKRSDTPTVRQTQRKPATPAATTPVPVSVDAADTRPNGHGTVVSITESATRRRRNGAPSSTAASDSGGAPTVADLADTLTKRFGAEYVGKPKALAYLKSVYGSCATDRALEAKDIHNARREQATPAQVDTPPSDDLEDSRTPQLIGASA